jgi:hypothetical protein
MIAELCRNGHIITGDIQNEPEKTSKFCSLCGAETIRACSNCAEPLRGDHIYQGTITWMTEPRYCHRCGAAFPWTIAKIVAAKEHAAEIEGLDDADRKQLQEVIDDVTVSGPRTDLGVSRLKRLVTKVGPAVGNVVVKIVVDVATDAAKKLIGG